ncbi:MAG: hypothetical protein NW215_10875 [Hyphomicrobiales bacterium]|nr:hypothetical protein [Hyphomicrobiales bacterium]
MSIIANLVARAAAWIAAPKAGLALYGLAGLAGAGVIAVAVGFLMTAGAASCEARHAKAAAVAERADAVENLALATRAAARAAELEGELSAIRGENERLKNQIRTSDESAACAQCRFDARELRGEARTNR